MMQRSNILAVQGCAICSVLVSGLRISKRELVELTRTYVDDASYPRRAKEFPSDMDSLNHKTYHTVKRMILNRPAGANVLPHVEVDVYRCTISSLG